MIDISVGQLLKRHVSEMKDRRLAAQILDDMNSGRLVSDSVVNAVFADAMEDAASLYGDTDDPLMIVLDGVPKTAGQIKPSVSSVTDKFNVPVSEFNIVHISTPPHICAYRMGIQGRRDGIVEAIVATRFKEYFEKILPAIKLLKDFTDNSESEFYEINGQFMIDEAYSYQKKLFSHLWPEYFPGMVRRIPITA